MSQLLRVGSAHSFRLPSKSDHRRPGSFVTLETRPRLRLTDERPQLAEQYRQRHPPTIERLDTFQPSQHLRRFVHADNASDQPVTCL